MTVEEAAGDFSSEHLLAFATSLERKARTSRPGTELHDWFSSRAELMMAAALYQEGRGK